MGGTVLEGVEYICKVAIYAVDVQNKDDEEQDVNNYTEDKADLVYFLWGYRCGGRVVVIVIGQPLASLVHSGAFAFVERWGWRPDWADDCFLGKRSLKEFHVSCCCDFPVLEFHDTVKQEEKEEPEDPIEEPHVYGLWTRGSR